MTKEKRILVLSISDLIRCYNNIKGKKTITIFITMNDEYDFEPTLQLEVEDCCDGEDKFIDMYQLADLKETLDEHKDADTIIVSCDAGISRSPAVGSAIALLMGNINLSEMIRKYHIHYNEDLFNFIIKYWRYV